MKQFFKIYIYICYVKKNALLDRMIITHAILHILRNKENLIQDLHIQVIFYINYIIILIHRVKFKISI